MGHAASKLTKLKRLNNQIYKTSPSNLYKLNRRAVTVENTKSK